VEYQPMTDWSESSSSTPVINFSGFLFKNDFEIELIHRIRSNQATLIDLRNYIFSRKARLLTTLERHSELAKAALDYVKIGYTGLLHILDNPIVRQPYVKKCQI